MTVVEPDREASRRFDNDSQLEHPFRPFRNPMKLRSFLVVGLVLVAALNSRGETDAQKSAEEARHSLRQQGFKTDLLSIDTWHRRPSRRNQDDEEITLKGPLFSYVSTNVLQYLPMGAVYSEISVRAGVTVDALRNRLLKSRQKPTIAWRPVGVTRKSDHFRVHPRMQNRLGIE
jgi:hypothetical protein